jgi:lipid II:glycine glycyltransferase (peptidoglycan interpeptide bridge formation enzyme)
MKEYVEKLKQEMHALQNENKRLEKIVKKSARLVQQHQTALATLQKEEQAARRIIWAMVSSTEEKEIAIPKDIMACAADDKNQLTSKYDPKSETTIISAI